MNGGWKGRDAMAEAHSLRHEVPHRQYRQTGTDIHQTLFVTDPQFVEMLNQQLFRKSHNIKSFIN